MLIGVEGSDKHVQGKVATPVTINTGKANGVGGTAPLILSFDTRGW